MAEDETESRRQQVGATFAEVASRFGPAPLILGHFDADGLAAAAIFQRSLDGATLRIVGKGENPWSEEIRSELRHAAPGGLIVTDLGVREGALLASTPTAIVDHHVPTGTPGDAVVISGHGWKPEPTSALLAYWCARGLERPTTCCGSPPLG
ncbi:DHH family phosphoesterase [Sphingomonas piscis]|uniref:DHH family phosphoesterase n=1 Tax=Sphingomonas piscis TaxID=2714943 RepID=UPI0019CF99D2|nr:hypothetical protein [Sphingomonas piscis]